MLMEWKDRVAVKSYFLVFALVFWSTALFANTSMIRQWQPPFDELVLEIAKSPTEVQRELENLSPTAQSENLYIAQYHALKSQVFYALSYPQKALEHAQTSLEFIDGQSQPWLYHNVKLNEAQAFDLVGNPNAGLQGANAAIVWAELNHHESLLTDGLFVRGALRNSLVDYQGALGDLQRAYELAPESGSSLTKGNVAGMLALVYEYRNEDLLAIPFFQEAADYNRQTGNDLELSIALYGLGRAYKNTGNIERGAKLLQESKTLAAKVNDEQGVAYAMKELAGIALSEGNIEQAEAMLFQAQQIFHKSQNRYMLLDTYRTMAFIALKAEQLERANQYLQAAYKAVVPDTMPIQYVDLQEVKASYLAKVGQYQAAYELLSSIQEPRRQHLSAQSTKQLHTLRSQYEIDVKQRENELLEQQNQLQQANLSAAEMQNLQLLLLFGATLIICMLLIILAYRTKKNRSQLETLANTDELTGLSNRRHSLGLLEQHIQMAQRHSLPLCVAIVDIDFFKKINDKFGHAVGDKVLIAFGELARKVFRGTDVVGRIGGEEFVIVLPHTNIDDGYKTLKSFSLKVKQLSGELDVQDLTLSISSGLTAFQANMDSETLMLRCDEALYEAKNSGRDRIIIT